MNRKQIYVWWDRNFDNKREFIEAGIRALFELLKLGEDISNEFEIRIFGNFRVGHEDFENADWYFEKSLDKKRNQVNASKLFNLCHIEPWQKSQPHIEVIFTSYDLYIDGTNFIFGLTIPYFGIVTSCHRIEKWCGKISPFAFFSITLHELGHLFSLPARIKNVEYKLGCHCVYKDCVMGQVNVYGRPDICEAALLILERYRNTKNYFCKECTEDLIRVKKEYIKNKRQENII